MKTTPKQALAAREKQLRHDRASLLQSDAFCRVLHEVMGLTGVFRSSFTGEQTHGTAFNEGQRNVGLQLLEQFESADPEFLQRLKAHAFRPDATPIEDDPDE